mmetsp:Transcript_39283/g.77275  ORF Transcript_39283/g.77275 Transcript_39283/m.77275 type:complete len:288 (-) Transcript_39283:74-937(-)
MTEHETAGQPGGPTSSPTERPSFRMLPSHAVDALILRSDPRKKKEDAYLARVFSRSPRSTEEVTEEPYDPVRPPPPWFRTRDIPPLFWIGRTRLPLAHELAAMSFPFPSTRDWEMALGSLVAYPSMLEGWLRTYLPFLLPVFKYDELTENEWAERKSSVFQSAQDAMQTREISNHHPLYLQSLNYTRHNAYYANYFVDQVERHFAAHPAGNDPKTHNTTQLLSSHRTTDHLQLPQTAAVTCCHRPQMQLASMPPFTRQSGLSSTPHPPRTQPAGHSITAPSKSGEER